MNKPFLVPAMPYGLKGHNRKNFDLGFSAAAKPLEHIRSA
jgi:hypothetical protein